MISIPGIEKNRFIKVFYINPGLQVLAWIAVRDEEIYAQIIDYSDAYPKGKSDSLVEVNYAQLKSGKITIQGKEVPTASLSSYARARKIAGILKEWIKKGEFFLTEPVELLPSVDSGVKFKTLRERKIKRTRSLQWPSEG
ncbi:unnamed protein product [marine sediment metagenome]|uniref:Homocysteine biosynthesis enzyme sulfur-incorporation domain-containing protein n=1 Tax=marine sediment metagenome TaxID=412755 RepID=X1B998_9ZZZZ